MCARADALASRCRSCAASQSRRGLRVTIQSSARARAQVPTTRARARAPTFEAVKHVDEIELNICVVRQRTRTAHANVGSTHRRADRSARPPAAARAARAPADASRSVRSAAIGGRACRAVNACTHRTLERHRCQHSARARVCVCACVSSMRSLRVTSWRQCHNWRASAPRVVRDRLAATASRKAGRDGTLASSRAGATQHPSARAHVQLDQLGQPAQSGWLEVEQIELQVEMRQLVQRADDRFDLKLIAFRLFVLTKRRKKSDLSNEQPTTATYNQRA